jgi:hypothetical protein
MFKRPWVMLLMASALFLNCDNSNPIDPSSAPKITMQPRSQIVLLGAPASFSVSITGDPAPTFQWYKAGTPLPGETDSLFIIPAVGFADTGTYSVTISNSKGTITSNTITLMVYSLTVTVQPLSDTVSVDSTFTFTASVAGIDAPTFQWRLDGFGIPGATGLAYSKAAATPDDAGTYQLVVTSPLGDVYSEPVILTVKP